MKRWFAWGAILVAVLAGARVPVFVDETQFVIVTRFGRPVRDLAISGLHWTWPWESVLRFDRRWQVYDPKPSEFLTREKKNLDLDVFVAWRIAEPRRFLETVLDLPGAEARLHDFVWSELAAEVGRNTLNAFVTTNVADHRVEEILSNLTARCATRAREAYGIEIAEVRIKRIGLPAQVRESVFQRMRAERGRIARQYRAEGEEQALRIRAEADRERAVFLAKADAEAERIRGRAEADATRIYAEAYGRDPEFYEFLRTLEAARNVLDENTTVLLSADSPLFRVLLHAGMSVGSTSSVPSGVREVIRP